MSVIIQAGDSISKIYMDNLNSQTKRKPEPRVSQTHKIPNVGRPGSKRYQRFLNKVYLLQHQHEVTDEDINVFLPSCSSFSFLVSTPYNQKQKEGREKWEPFVNVTEEREREMIVDILPKSDYDQNEIVSAERSWSLIDKRIRQILKSNTQHPFLLDLENEIIEFVASIQSDSIVYHFEEPFHRMICHGICSFYSIQSSSIDKNQQRTTIIRKTTKTVIPGITLSNFLKRFCD